MNLFSKFSRTAKRAIGFENIKNDSGLLLNLGKSIYKQTITPSHSDNNALPRKLSAEQINQLMHKYRVLFKVHAVLFIAIVAYCLLNIYWLDYLSAVVSGALVLVELAQIFRLHFFMFRLKTGNLSANFMAWFRYTFPSLVRFGIR